ncbi:MAG: pyrroline-5-carboxylate reductase [Clostridiales bacterium]|nr:pyrroline-5-carboxylate reductase [Clostridiales bacterium]
MKYVFGFLGTGNMGSALVRAVCKTVDSNKICICDQNKDKTNSLKTELGLNVENAENLVKNSEFLVLGVKPQMLESVTGELADAMQDNASLKIISMLAAVDTQKLASCFGDREYIRIMPNTPVNLGEGAVLYCVRNASQSTEKTFTTAFEKAGKVVKIEENLMDGGMSLSGCGPAFVYMFIDALKQAGEKLGLDSELALTLATQTVKGSAMMVEKFGNPEQLKINVCSPGGTTIEGVKSLENDDLYKAVENALNASYEKSKILAKK